MSTENSNREKSEVFTPVVIGIFTSIVGSVLYSIFQNPILRSINFAVSGIISPFYKGFIDHQYQQAALGPTNAILFFINSMIITGLASLAIGMAVIGFASGKSLKKRIERLEGNNGAEPYTANLSRLKMLRRWLKYLSILLLILVIPETLVNMSSSFIFTQAYSSYDLRLRALAPFISDQEAKGLIGAWAVIKSRKDYEMFISSTDALAKKYNAQIPAPLI